MTISDSKRRELEASETPGSVLARTSVLTLALLSAQYAYPTPDLITSEISTAKTEGTIAQSLFHEITELEVFKQINRIYDELLSHQIELDSEAKRVLYANLWNLYT